MICTVCGFLRGFTHVYVSISNRIANVYVRFIICFQWYMHILADENITSNDVIMVAGESTIDNLDGIRTAKREHAYQLGIEHVHLVYLTKSCVRDRRH